MADLSLGVKVDTGQAAAGMDNLADSAAGASGKLTDVTTAIDKTGEASQSTTAAVTDLSQAVTEATADFSGLIKMLNEFVQAKGAALGKPVKLFDEQNLASLEEIRDTFQNLVKSTKNLPGTVGHSLSNQQGGALAIKSPEQINLSAYSSDAKKQQEFLNRILTSLLAKLSNNPTGLAITDLYPTRPSPAAQPGTGLPDPAEPKQAKEVKKPKEPDTPFDKSVKLLGYTARQVSPLAGGVGGALSQAGKMGMEGYAGRGLGGMVAGAGLGGMAAGAGIGALAYGVYKAASAVSEGVDREKVLATDIDKFRRSLGGTADKFSDLVDQSRLLAGAFSLTHEVSRRLTTEFAQISKVNDVNQAKEGVGLAQSVGLDEARGSQFMASMRRDGAIGNKQQDARMLAMQFAEALKRTGSTLNAGELMHAMQSFGAETARRSMIAPNMESFAGVLSAMVGTKLPGMTVDNAAGIMNKFDASFRAGGRMGDASSNFQYKMLGGDGIGPLGVAMLEEAGPWATSNQVYNSNSPANQYLGDQGFNGRGDDISSIEKVIGGIVANQGGNRKREIETLQGLAGMGVQEASIMLLLHKQQKLHGMSSMMGQYENGDELLKKMGADGYMLAADTAKANGNVSGPEGLKSIVESLKKRSDLTKEQSAAIKGMDGMTDGAKLQDALVKFATTMKREETDGQKILKAAVDTANSTDLIGQKLVPAVIMTNNFLSELVKKVSPNSPYLNELNEQNRRARNAISPKDIKSGSVSSATIAEINSDAIAELRKPMSMIIGSGITGQSRMKVLEDQYRLLGDKAIIPYDVESSFGKGEIAAMKLRVDSEPKTATDSASVAGGEIPLRRKPTSTGGGQGLRGVTAGTGNKSEVAASMAKFMPAISESEKTFGLASNSMLALIQQENGQFDPTINHGTNPDGTTTSASGLTQITKGTWDSLNPMYEKRFGERPDKTNPNHQILAGALNLQKHLKKENGNLRFAYAAYHGGEGWRNNPAPHLAYADEVLSKMAKANQSMTASPGSSPVSTPDAKPVQRPADAKEPEKPQQSVSVSVAPIQITGEFLAQGSTGSGLSFAPVSHQSVARACVTGNLGACA